MNRLGLTVMVWAILTVAVAPGTASAQRWTAAIEKDDFGDNHIGLATIVSGGVVFGLRCENKKVPSLIYATNQRWGDALSAASAQLLLRVGGGDVIRKLAVLDAYEVGAIRRVRVIAAGDHLFPAVEEIAKASGRVSVAVALFGETLAQQRFSTSGATAAFRHIWQYCGSALGTYDKPKL